MLSDAALVRDLLRAVARLEVEAAWPPDPASVQAFEEALDGVARRKLVSEYETTDGYVSGELVRTEAGIFSAGEFWMLGAPDAPPKRRAEAQLSSSAGGWIHVVSEARQRDYEQLSRRQRASVPRLDRWTFTVEIPDPSDS